MSMEKMGEKILVDINVPREVSERLEDLGFDMIYLTEKFPQDTADEEIFEWMEANDIPILTRDKRFPENGGDLKITIESQSSVKLTRKAFSKLMDSDIYPKPLAES